MSPPAYRPPSVWITQALLVPSLVTMAIALVIGLFQCFSSEPTLSCTSPPRIASFVSGFVSFGLIFLTFWGLQTRKRYGRWLAVSMLIGGMIVAIAESHSFHLIYRSITQWQPLPAPPYDCWEKQHPFDNISYSCGYQTYPGMVARLTADILPALILGFLATRLLFSAAAKRFFQNRSPQ